MLTRIIKKFLKGWVGETKASFNLWLSLDEDKYHRINGIIIPGNNGTTQIDHLVISQFGIFIIETKNKDGWIFGSEDQAEWTQSFYHQKYSFQNPLRQLYRQKKVLANFLQVKDSKIKTVAYFVGNCKFKTDMPANVLRTDPSRYISRFFETILSPEEVERCVRKMARHMTSSKISTSDHIRSLNVRHNSTSICPKCGGDLILKEAKKGAQAGLKFLGCKNYPRCRFTRDA